MHCHEHLLVFAIFFTLKGNADICHPGRSCWGVGQCAANPGNLGWVSTLFWVHTSQARVKA